MSKKTLFFSLMVASLTLAACRDRAVPATASEPVNEEAPAAEATPVATIPASNAIDESTARSITAEALAAASWTRNACSLDMIDKGAPDVTLKKGQPHLFEGFMLDANGAPAGAFLFVLKGDASTALPVSTGQARPDVADFFKNPDLTSAGFEFTSTLSAVAAGDYEVVFVLERDGVSYFCESGKRLTVE